MHQKKQSQRARRIVGLWKLVVKIFARRQLWLVPVISALGLVFLVISALIVFNLGGQDSVLRPINSTSVQISYDGQIKTIPTNAKTVGELLQKLDITVGQYDSVEPSSQSEIFGDNFRVNVYRGRPVVIDYGNKRIFAVSSATTPRSIARQVGIEVYPEDKLEVDSAGDFMQTYALGKQITITRSVPVNLNMYGSFTGVRTLAKTVGQLLDEASIALPSDSNVFPDRATKIKADMQIFVTSKDMKIEVHEESIAMPVETIEDKSLSFGASVVRQQGSPGKKLITYKIDQKTGHKEKLQEFVSAQPVTQIVARGQAINIPKDKRQIMAQAGLAESDYAYVDYIISRESGWCPTKLEGQYGYCPGYAPEVIPNYGGYGLCQSTPGSKMAQAGSDWKTNAITQLRWCSTYSSRYGGWAGAYNFWQAHHWW